MADKRKIFVQELLENQVIEQETADKILHFYHAQEENQPNKILIIFSALGALLVGLGILLLIAANWDEFPIFIQTIFAFVPLLVGQSIGYHTLKNKSNSQLWKEVSAVFTSISVASAIAMIHQIYNLPENSFANFLLIWMLLILPLIYLFDSSTTFIIYIIGTTYFGYESSYGTHHAIHLKWLYWPMMAAIIPFYYQYAKKVKQSSFVTFCHLLFLCSITSLYPSFFTNHFSTAFVGAGFASLGSLYIVIGKSYFLEKMNQERLSFMVVGATIILIVATLLSFEFGYEHYEHVNFIHSTFVCMFPVILSAYVIWKEKIKIPILACAGPVFFTLALIGMNFGILATILTNICILVFGIYQIYSGMKVQDLPELNIGLLFISVLILARFFDTNIDFVVRGLVFIALGCMFFAVNYKMIQSKKNEK